MSIHELAALDALGLLSEEEALELRRVSTEDGGNAALLNEYREAASLIATAVDPIAPPPDVRSRVLSAVTGGFTLRAEEGRWHPLVPGVRMKKLSSDRTRGTVTVLMEMAAASTIPPHEHRHAEDSFVVSGSCSLGGVALAAGDFHRAAAGTRHDAIVTDTGCLLLLVMDERDYRAA